jgi:Trypsin-co-occurring domain 1
MTNESADWIVEVVDQSGRISRQTDNFEKRFPEVAECLEFMIASLRSRDLFADETKPLSVSSLEFSVGLTLEAEGGLIIGRVKGSATFEVKVTLERSAPK